MEMSTLPEGEERSDLLRAAQRRQRVEQRARLAVESLAESSFPLAASLLRIARVEVLDPEQAGEITTAALCRDTGPWGGFRVLLNAEFCDRPQRDVSAIMMHELFHHLLRHLELRPPGPDPLLCNLVQDSHINLTISQVAPELAGFMRDFYPESSAPALFLRPDSLPTEPRDQEMYTRLYARHSTDQDLYAYLSSRGMEREARQVQLLGSHEGESVIPPEQVPQLLDELAEALQQAGELGARESARLRELKEQFQRVQAKKMAGLEKLFQRNLVDSVRTQIIREVCGEARDAPRRSPIMPDRLHRADQYLLLAGVRPHLWRTPEEDASHGAVYVYLDVSGSMREYFSLIYGCCLGLEDYLSSSLFLFSNQISEISLEQLRDGRIRSTYGTDFDCVVEHFLGESEAANALLFTDGYAGLSAPARRALRESGRKLTGVLTPGGTRECLESFCSSIFQLPVLEDGSERGRRA